MDLHQAQHVLGSAACPHLERSPDWSVHDHRQVHCQGDWNLTIDFRNDVIIAGVTAISQRVQAGPESGRDPEHQELHGEQTSFGPREQGPPSPLQEYLPDSKSW